MKQLFRFPLFGMAIALAAFSAVSDLVAVEARSLTSDLSDELRSPLEANSSQSRSAVRRGLIAKSNSGKPNTRRGQIGKADCPAAQLPLTALVPETMDGAQTLSKHPTFWFYVPYTRVNRFSAEFVLQDNEGNSVYRTPVRLPEVPSIVSVQIPPTEAALEADTPYRWRFQVNCSSPALRVTGWIQRGEINPMVKTAQPLQRAAFYIEHGLWYDALSAIGEKRRANPQDGALMQAWVNLLSQLELKDVASEPMAQ